MTDYLIKEMQYIRRNMEEHVIMAETLGDAISSFLDKSYREIFYNRFVKKSMSRTAAMIEFRLRSEQVHFVDMKKVGVIDESIRRDLLIQIMGLKEELEDVRYRMTLLVKIQMDTETMRCVFRTIGDRIATMTLLDFVQIYNKWVDVSAEYLILKAIREIACGDGENKNSIFNPDKLTAAKEVMAKEYDKTISEQENMLRSYCEDLHKIAEELDENYDIIDVLDKLIDENTAIEN